MGGFDTYLYYKDEANWVEDEIVWNEKVLSRFAIELGWPRENLTLS